MFLTNTRPYLQFSVSLFARYFSDPSIVHLKEEKRILIYVKGTTTMEYIIHVIPSSNLQVLVIVIGEVIWMIGRAQVGIDSLLDQV